MTSTLFPILDENLLPRNGTAQYYGNVLTKQEADKYFATLRHSIEWTHDEVVIFGKRHITKREMAWYGDHNFAYTYSGTTRTALPWTPELKGLKQLVESVCKQDFNSCLLNLYHHGEEGMGYHSDDETTLGKNPVIASMSLGAERKFTFKHKVTKETRSIMLENGSILLMKDETQHHWLHSLPKTKKVMAERINLTFRKFIRK